MIEDLPPIGQEKFPIFLGRSLDCVFDSDEELPYKIYFGNRTRE
jgi:hypothetical protein